MGKFVITTTKNGEFTFNLKATNGQVILTASESYSSEDGVKGGIESVENFETLTHPKYEVYQDKAGEYRFRLKAKNGQNIGKSEGYKTKASCLNGIESVGKNGPEAEIIAE